MQRRTFMKRILIYLAFTSLTLILGLYIYLALSSDPAHFWRKVSGAEVTYNNQKIPEARVYRHPNGKILINLRENQGWRIYYPEEQNIGLCNPIRYVQFPGYIYAYDCESKFCPCVMMGTAKVGVDAQLIKGEKFIEFNSLNWERIKISW
jgi:hypothetical protein